MIWRYIKKVIDKLLTTPAARDKIKTTKQGRKPERSVKNDKNQIKKINGI